MKPTRKEAKKEFMKATSSSHKIGAPKSLLSGPGLKTPKSKTEKKEYKKYKKEYIKER